METLLKDCKYALRALYKNPGFSLSALILLAVGIGASGAIFSVADGVVLKPLPYLEPDRLVRIYGAWAQGEREGISPPDFFDYRTQTHSLESVAAEGNYAPVLNLSGQEKPVQIKARAVTAGFFHVLGVTPILGREFHEDEEVWKGPKVVMLSYALWSDRYAKDPSIVGRQITLNIAGYTVVGVLPPFFDLGGSSDVYLPQQQKIEIMRKFRTQIVIGRLKQNAAPSDVQNEMNVVAGRLAQSYADADKGWRVIVLPLQNEVVSSFRAAIFMLLGSVVLVVLIVTANLANLVLAKVAGRRAEIAIRFALGASRLRLIRQLLTESLLLALMGGAIGCAVSFFCVALVKDFGPASIPRLSSIRIDATVVVFMLLISALIGLFLAFVPVLWTRKMAVTDDMKQSSRILSSGLGGAQTGLMVAEIAVTVVLLVGSTLLIRSLIQMENVDPGFRADHLLTTRVTLPFFTRYNSNEKLAGFWRTLIPKIESLPGVESAAITSELPLSGLNNPTPFKAITPDQKEYHTYVRSISPEFLATMRVPLLAGRNISPEDRENTTPVVVINDLFKRDVFGSQDPLGKHLIFPFDTTVDAVVIGVVGNFRHSSLAEQPFREVYMPVEQGAVLGYNLIVRTKTDPATLIKPVEAAVWSLDPDEAMAPFETMDEIVEKSLVQERFRTLILALFSGVALILAAIGMYGVLSYLVSQRSQEIGIRMALGAKQNDILRMVLARGLILNLVGMLIGGAMALGATRLINNLLFGISALDPLTFLGVLTLLILIGLVASSLPAWRAARIDPVCALRNE